ncbi:DUF2800 domain-containing protein [Sphingomonas sp. RB3P16]|uniref:DUF2800 domain-containing protein n=1 Tax=Parasphingomonas frigoris TaxID=3096163 RepID=UPI002FC7A963
MSADDQLPAHSEHSPSSAEGWTNCADYINANQGLPDVSSWEAAEGTAAHWIRNECLTRDMDAFEFIGHIQKIGEWEFQWTADDAMLLQPGINWLRSHGGQFYGEHRVDLTKWLGHDSFGRPQGGTLDGGIVTGPNEDDPIIIDDEKWGRGVPVSPVRNKQTMLYALGFWDAIARHKTKSTTFLLSIDQPRHMTGGGKWRVSLAELLAFGEWVKARADATRAPNPPRTASEKGCLWCRRKNAPGGCGTLDAYVLKMLEMEFEDLDEPFLSVPQKVTPDRRRVLIDHTKMITDWLDALYARCMEDALAGMPAGGLKAVLGRKDSDRWIDEKGQATPAVVSVLGAKSFTQKLISPTATAKAVDTDSFDWTLKIEPLIKRGQRKPTLVDISHDLPAIVSGEEFDDLD